MKRVRPTLLTLLCQECRPDPNSLLYQFCSMETITRPVPPDLAFLECMREMHDTHFFHIQGEQSRFD